MNEIGIGALIAIAAVTGVYWGQSSGKSKYFVAATTGFTLFLFSVAAYVFSGFYFGLTTALCFLLCTFGSRYFNGQHIRK